MTEQREVIVSQHLGWISKAALVSQLSPLIGHETTARREVVT